MLQKSMKRRRRKDIRGSMRRMRSIIRRRRIRRRRSIRWRLMRKSVHRSIIKIFYQIKDIKLIKVTYHTAIFVWLIKPGK